jgi:hypothetical protein
MRGLLKTKFWNALYDGLPVLRNSTQAVKDWLIEYLFSRFIGSAFIDSVIQHSQYVLLSSLLLQLRDLEDFFGVLKLAFPILCFVLVGSIRQLLDYRSELYRRTRAKLKRKL